MIKNKIFILNKNHYRYVKYIFIIYIFTLYIYNLLFKVFNI